MITRCDVFAPLLLLPPESRGRASMRIPKLEVPLNPPLPLLRMLLLSGPNAMPQLQSPASSPQLLQ
jgi:hypothetical protein